MGMKKLAVRIGEKHNSRTVDVTFLVVDVPMAYNVIIGRPTLSAVKAAIAPYLLLMQFELDDGRVGKLFGNQRMACECYYVSPKSLGVRGEPPVAESSRPSKSIRKGEPKAVMMLSASAEDHGRSCPESTAVVEEAPWTSTAPYIIFEEVRPGSSWLTTFQGVKILRAWHSPNLCRYFV